MKARLSLGFNVQCWYYIQHGQAHQKTQGSSQRRACSAAQQHGAVSELCLELCE